MPQAFVIVDNKGGLDKWEGPGQLVEESGIISDMDGGFDTATCTVLVADDGSSEITVGAGAIQPYPGLYLFGVSPKRIIGGGSLITLSYKGFYKRSLLGGTPPAKGSKDAKFTWGCQMSTRAWPKGSLTGTIDGVVLADHPVNVLEPHQTVKVAWLGSSPVDRSVFDTSTAIGSGSFGVINDGPYSAIADATYNFPHGWVPTDSSSEQAYAGLDVYLNSVTYTGFPKFTAG